jgi:hypothetical protein
VLDHVQRETFVRELVEGNESNRRRREPKTVDEEPPSRGPVAGRRQVSPPAQIRDQGDGEEEHTERLQHV